MEYLRHTKKSIDNILTDKNTEKARRLYSATPGIFLFCLPLICFWLLVDCGEIIYIKYKWRKLNKKGTQQEKTRFIKKYANEKEKEQYFMKYGTKTQKDYYIFVPKYCKNCYLLLKCREPQKEWKCRKGCIIINNRRKGY